MCYLEIIKQHQAHWELKRTQIKITHLFLTITKENIDVFFDFLRYAPEHLEFIAIISKKTHISSQELGVLKWAHLNHPRVNCVFLRTGSSTANILESFISKLLKNFKFPLAILSGEEWSHIWPTFSLLSFAGDKIDFNNAISGCAYDWDPDSAIHSLRLKGTLPLTVSLRDAAIEIKKAIDKLGLGNEELVWIEILDDSNANFGVLDRITIWETFKVISAYKAKFFWIDRTSTSYKADYTTVTEVDLSVTEINLYNLSSGKRVCFETPQDSMIVGKHFTFMYESCMNQDFLKVVCLIQKLSHLNFTKGSLVSSWHIPEDIIARLEVAMPTFLARCGKLGIKLVKHPVVSPSTNFSSLWEQPKNNRREVFCLSSIQLAMNWLASDEKSLEDMIASIPSARDLRAMRDLIMKPNKLLDLTLSSRYNKLWHTTKVIDIAELGPEFVTPYHMSQQDQIIIAGDRLNVKVLPHFSKKRLLANDMIFKRSVTAIDGYLARSNVQVIVAGQYNLNVYQDLVLRGILPLHYNLSKLSFDSSEIAHVSLVLESINSFNGKVRLRLFLYDGRCISIFPKLFFISYKHFQCFMR
jgi:hypothetical protein